MFTYVWIPILQMQSHSLQSERYVLKMHEVGGRLRRNLYYSYWRMHTLSEARFSPLKTVWFINMDISSRLQGKNAKGRTSSGRSLRSTIGSGRAAPSKASEIEMEAAKSEQLPTKSRPAVIVHARLR